MLDLRRIRSDPDAVRAARTSGSRFAYLVGDVARLWLAIQQFALAHDGVPRVLEALAAARGG